MKPNLICFTKQKFRFEEEGERERDFGRIKMREFLFGNFQIGFTSQRLVSKTSWTKLGTTHEN